MANSESVLSRMGDIMAANMHSILDKLEDPAKAAEQQCRKLRKSLAEVQDATSEVMAHETGCRRKVDELQKQIDNCTEVAKKALRAGNEGDARTMLEKKQNLETQKATADKALEIAATNAKNMRAMHDKLLQDIAYCEGKMNNVKATNAMAKAQEGVNKTMQRIGSATQQTESFSKYEEKAQQRLDKATAAASLIAGAEDPTEAIEAKYAGATSSSVEDELSALKASMGL